MNDAEQHVISLLKPIIWDYRLDPLDFYRIALGQQAGQGWFTQEWALRRLLERLNWYDLIDLFGLDFLKVHLTPQLVAKLRIKELRHRYEIARCLLNQQPLPLSGWDSQTRQRCQDAVLSNRWYRSRSFLL